MPRRNVADAEWERYRAELQALYLDMTADQVRVYMVENYNFSKLTEEYRQRFKKWGFKKTLTDDEYKFIFQRVEKRKLDGLDSAVSKNEIPVSEKKLKRGFSRIPLSYGCSNNREPQTPEGISVHTPAALSPGISDSGNLPDELVTCPSLPLGNLEFNLESLSAPGIDPLSSALPTRFQQLSEHDTFPDDTLNFNPPPALDSLSILDFDDIPSLNGIATFDIPQSPESTNLASMIPTEVDLASEDSLAEARLLLQHYVKRRSPLLLTGDNVDDVTLSLEPVMVEQSDGDSTQNSKNLFGSSKSDALLHLFRLFVYLSSNNLMSDLEMSKLLSWITSNGFRWLLKDMFTSKTTTVEVFTSNLLRTAVRQEDVETTQCLIEAGVECDAPGGMVVKQTPLQEAVDIGNVRLVGMLLDAGANPNSVVEGETPLHGAFDMRQTLDLVQILLGAGADANPQQDPTKFSPLQLAVNSAQIEVVQLLLDRKADPNAFTTCDKGTALQLACQQAHPEMVELLVRAGADVDATSSYDYESDDDAFSCVDDILEKCLQPPLQIAANHGRWEALQILLEEGAGVNPPLSKYPNSVLLELIEDNLGWRVTAVTPLQAAIKAGNITMARSLLSAGAHIDSRPRNNLAHTALQVAVLVGNERLVRILLQKGADVNAIAGDFHGCTALQAAAGDGNSELLTFLLESGADVNAPAGKEYGGTALQTAAMTGNVEGIELLIEAGADVNAPPSPIGGKTALQAAIGNENDTLEIVRILLKAKADVNAPPAVQKGTTALQAAATIERLDIIELLLAFGGLVNPPATRQGYSMLQAAVEKANIEMVAYILSRGADPNMPTCSLALRTPLQEASSQGNIDMIQLLLQWGADANAPPYALRGLTALQAAARTGSLAAVMKLIEAGCNINAPPADRDGMTVLQAAVFSGNCELVRFLLHSVTPATFSVGKTSGLLSIAMRNWRCFDDELVKILIRAGADVNTSVERYKSKTTVLQEAARGEKFNIVQMLLAAGADVNVLSVPRNEGPITALQAAVLSKNIDIVQMLLDKGADTNVPANPKGGMTALQAAVSSRSWDIIQLLMRKGVDINAPASLNRGKTALQEAASGGHVTLTRYFLRCGANVNAPPAYSAGATALQGAAIAGNIRIMLMLLVAGADINGAPAVVNGRTAIEGAAENGRLDTLHMLLDYHPATDDLELKRKRAAKMAIGNGHFAIARFIKAYKKG